MQIELKMGPLDGEKVELNYLMDELCFDSLDVELKTVMVGDDIFDVPRPCFVRQIYRLSTRNGNYEYIRTEVK